MRKPRPAIRQRPAYPERFPRRAVLHPGRSACRAETEAVRGRLMLAVAQGGRSATGDCFNMMVIGYSFLSASFTSTRRARRAGSRHATVDTLTIVTAAAVTANRS